MNKHIKVAIIPVNFYIIYSLYHLILVSKYLRLILKLSDHSVYFSYLVRIHSIEFEYNQLKMFITLKIVYIKTVWFYFTIYLLSTFVKSFIVWPKFVLLLQTISNSCRDNLITYLLKWLSQTTKDEL